LKGTLCVAAFLLLAAAILAQDPSPKQIQLPTSKILTAPIPGHIGPTNSFPATIALSSDEHYAALLNDGYGTQASGAYQSIAVLDLQSGQVNDFPDRRFPEGAHQSYFLGLAFSSDGNHLYASVGSITDPTGERPGDTGNGIAVYKFSKGKITPERFLKIPPQKIGAGKRVARALRETSPGTAIAYPAGIAVIAGETSDKLLIANNLSDNVIVLDSSDDRILNNFDLSDNQVIPSSFPYTVAATPEGQRAWCTLWNASHVAELYLRRGTISRWIPLLEPSDPTAAGSHPSALLLNADESLLYVALSNSDRVAVVSTARGDLVAMLDTSLLDQKFSGTFPTALVQSTDGKQLFVADSSLNAIAVFDVSRENANLPVRDLPILRPLGFVPTGWYPSAITVAGDDLLIAAAKGQGTGPNNGANTLRGERHHRIHPYLPTLLYGSVSRVNIPSIKKNLAEFTRKVNESNLLQRDPGKIEFQSGSNPIRHVIYVIKENRTYDQVFGDLKVGNGDPSLTMYGADITPNEHQLALQFGVLDNFYDSGEVSGDGHDWSTAAITSDYNEKTWQIAYRGKERIYDYQGTVADEYPLELGEPDVDDPATGFLWDNLARHNLTYRDYGEFIEAEWCKPQRPELVSPTEGTTSPRSAECAREEIHKGDPLPRNVGDPHGSASPWPWVVPILKRMHPTKAALRDHFDPLYPDFNTEYPDQLRADEFLNEFTGFVRAKTEGKGTKLPQFVLLYLPDDHTHGTAPGKPRPAASVADNDLALGRVVEAVSHSPYWDDTAILVLEDDAQDGADHVDAHRSIAFVVSKYSPGSTAHPFVDSRFCTTVNMVHTIETLLGLPPMNQNDAYAPVIAPLFSGPGNQPPFTADGRNRNNGLIYQVNPPRGQGARESARMDFSRPDAANPALLNRILWLDRKASVPMPPPRH